MYCYQVIIKLQQTYLPTMRNTIVVDEDKIPFLPRIEHHVPPHDIPHMLHVLLCYLWPIAIHGVETTIGPATDVEKEKLEEEHQNREEEVLYSTQAFVHPIQFVPCHIPVEHLQRVQAQYRMHVTTLTHWQMYVRTYVCFLLLEQGRSWISDGVITFNRTLHTRCDECHCHLHLNHTSPIVDSEFLAPSISTSLLLQLIQNF